jgi:hypothetical protein
VWARGVVVVEPVWQRGGALAVRAVDEAVSPFASHRLVEALHLSVRARPVGLGGQVSDPEPLELLSDESAACVGPGVIRVGFRNSANPLWSGGFETRAFGSPKRIRRGPKPRGEKLTSTRSI